MLWENLLSNIEKQYFSYFLSLFALKNFHNYLMKDKCHLNILNYMVRVGPYEGVKCV